MFKTVQRSNTVSKHTPGRHFKHLTQIEIVEMKNTLDGTESNWDITKEILMELKIKQHQLVVLPIYALI